MLVTPNPNKCVSTTVSIDWGFVILIVYFLCKTNSVCWDLNSGLAKLRAVRNVQQPKKYSSWAYDKTDPPAGLRNFLVYEAALSILAHRYLYISIDYYFTTFSIDDWRSIDMMLIWCQNVVSPSHHIYICIYIYIYRYINIHTYI